MQRPGRWTDNADTHGWTSKPRALGACSRSHEPTGRQGQDRWSLHIAGLNNTGYATRLHQMGQAGRPGLEQVEGRDYCGPSLHGPGPRCAVIGNVPFRTVTTLNLSELYTDPQHSFLRSGEIWWRVLLRYHPLYMNTSDTSFKLSLVPLTVAYMQSLAL